MKQTLFTMNMPNGVSIKVDFDSELLESPTTVVTYPEVKIETPVLDTLVTGFNETPPTVEISEKQELTTDWCRFSVRTVNALRKNGVDTVSKLKEMDGETLRSFRGFGAFCLSEVKEWFFNNGLKLRGTRERKKKPYTPLPESLFENDPLGIKARNHIKEINELAEAERKKGTHHQFMLSTHKYPYAELKVGESFEIDVRDKKKKESICESFYSHGRKFGKKFAFRREGVSGRIYRMS